MKEIQSSRLIPPVICDKFYTESGTDSTQFFRQISLGIWDTSHIKSRTDFTLNKCSRNLGRNLSRIWDIFHSESGTNSMERNLVHIVPTIYIYQELRADSIRMLGQNPSEWNMSYISDEICSSCLMKSVLYFWRNLPQILDRITKI